MCLVLCVFYSLIVFKSWRSRRNKFTVRISLFVKCLGLHFIHYLICLCYSNCIIALSCFLRIENNWWALWSMKLPFSLIFLLGILMSQEYWLRRYFCKTFHSWRQHTVFFVTSYVTPIWKFFQVFSSSWNLKLTFGKLIFVYFFNGNSWNFYNFNWWTSFSNFCICDSLWTLDDLCFLF